MCTLTFIPKTGGNFVITSNRDEAPNRETLPPDFYEIDGSKLLFPKDGLAGGTWIGVSDRQRFVSLMNGGFEAHERKAEYRMSRGIIVTDLLAATDLVDAIENYNLHDIEPFTVVAVEWANDLRIYELVWDGTQKHLEEQPLAPAIWSSSLLYSEEMKQKRNQWFAQFLFENLDPGSEDMWKFHHEAGDGNKDTDLIMDRVFVKTKSITQVQVEKGVEMIYEDLQTNELTRSSL